MNQDSKKTMKYLERKIKEAIQEIADFKEYSSMLIQERDDLKKQLEVEKLIKRLQ